MLLTSRCFWGILVASVGLGAHAVQAQTRPAAPLPTAPSDEQSYKKEFVYGVNFNTQAGLIGGVSVRSARMLDERLLRFWSIEGVMLKNKKEEQVSTNVGGCILPIRLTIPSPCAHRLGFSASCSERPPMPGCR